MTRGEAGAPAKGGVRAPVGVIVLGASGYAGGELLRWIGGHPRMELLAAVSNSHGNQPIGNTFPHLAPTFPDRNFAAPADLPAALSRGRDEFPRLAAFSAAPHTASAPAIARLLEAASAAGADPPVVDLSADFRHAEAARFQEIYGVPHPTPELVPRFHCGLPELDRRKAGIPATGRLFAHPGCFASAVALAAAPLVHAGLANPEIHASGITGSTGSGGKPKSTTHHPVRHANLYSYKPLAHRHAPEMETLLGFPGEPQVRVRFVPHSGPFARGIHITVFAALRKDRAGLTDEALERCYRGFYRGAPLVRTAPIVRLKEIVGTAGTVTGAHTDGSAIAAFSALDNLGKGAASGAMQWMNLALGFPEETGLTAPAAGWL